MAKLGSYIEWHITVIFDSLPDPELLPNNLRREHWAVRSRASKAARQEAYIRGRDAISWLPDFKTMDHCDIEEKFFVPNKRRRDIESLLAAAKAWIDGLVDAEILTDDDWQHVRKLTGLVYYFRGIERTEITIRSVE